MFIKNIEFWIYGDYGDFGRGNGFLIHLVYIPQVKFILIFIKNIGK